MMQLEAAGVLGRLMRYRANVCHCEPERGHPATANCMNYRLYSATSTVVRRWRRKDGQAAM